MKRSIQKRLLLVTLTLFFSAWLIFLNSIYVSFFNLAGFSHDADLKNYALIIDGFSHRLIVGSDEVDAAKRIQEELADQYEISLAFNITFRGKVVAKSIDSPIFPASYVQGVRNVSLSNAGQLKTWRVFDNYNSGDELWVTVGETREAFNDMIASVILRTIWPYLAFLPFMLGVIFIGIRQSLKPLNVLASQVENKTHEDLNPLDLGEAPREVEPLVRSLNDLLGRLKVAFDNEHAFTANAAHELRTPLASLKTEAQILQRHDIPESALKAVKRIEVRVDRATHLVAQLLTLARMESGANTKYLESVNLNVVITETLTDLQSQASAEKVLLEFSPTDSITVIGESIALGILVRNLVDNAIRYSPEGSTVTVQVAKESGRPRLSIIDNGSGLPKDVLPDVFQKFYRAPGVMESGVGLGLSIVERIVHLHAAEIKLSAGPNQTGLQFDITFPKSG